MGHRILILGGGFAGLAAVDHFRRRRGNSHHSVCLIDIRTESIFSPLLPDVISQRISSENILYPLEKHCRRRKVEFVQARVLDIHTDTRKVVTSQGTFDADFLLLCLGCETNYFGKNTLKQHVPGLKSVSDAAEIRHQALTRFEAARQASAKAHYLIVGGGYTGFETASHLALLLSRHSGLSWHELSELADITILEKMDHPLQNVSPGARRWACKQMMRWGITVRAGLTVSDVHSTGRVELTDGTYLDDAMVIWTAGVTPSSAIASIDAPRVANGRLEVDPYLRVGTHQSIFAAGDIAGPIKPGGDRPFRMSVQFSLYGGTLAAENILRTLQNKPLRQFDPLDPGYVVPLAPWRALGVILGCNVKGRLPSALHYFMCLYRSRSQKNRMRILRNLLQKETNHG